MASKKVTTANDLFYLLTCALNNQKADFVKVSKMNLAEIFSLAELHKLAACVAFALENIGLEEENFKQWKQAKSIAVRKNILLNNEREQIYSYMENNSIRHASLKGIVMQNLYPKFGMREMGDNDILYDSAYQEKMYDFMIKRGYKAEVYKKAHHDEYHKPPVYNFELHTKLVNHSDYPIIYDYYFGVLNKLKPVQGKKYELSFSDEDFYVYNVVHSYKHYMSGGTGLRILTDCYVYLLSKGETLNITYIEKECEKLGIADYEKNCRSLSQKLFSPNSINIEFTNDEEQLLNRIISSGAYGRHDYDVENTVTKMAERENNTYSLKMKYYFKRIFLPMDYIKDYYPFFYRNKILLPCLFIYRVFRVFTISRSKIRNELRVVDETISNMKK